MMASVRIVSSLPLLLLIVLLQVATLEEKCREMMMLKFGRVVDLEQLESLTVNKLAEELQRKIKEQEKLANKELAQLKVIFYNEHCHIIIVIG